MTDWKNLERLLPHESWILIPLRSIGSTDIIENELAVKQNKWPWRKLGAGSQLLYH